ncbi:MAG: hypothetical protein IJ261_04600 [Clostridia bacterium]|nr:hypothetical protein [Clostridia bacterium]
MNNERIRVRARILLVGKSRAGNCLVLFSAVLRILVYTLAAITALRLRSFMLTTYGKTVLILCAVAVALGALLLQCVRTVKDRWYACACEDKQISVTELITAFSVRDVLLSLRSGFASLIFTLGRLLLFLFFPSVFTAFTAFMVRDGLSVTVFAVMLLGNILLWLCSLFFAAVSLNCVSLARSVCSGKNGFVSGLKILDSSAFSLFRFGVMLSVFNRSYRRLSKIIFVRQKLFN